MTNQYKSYQEMVINVNSGMDRMEQICSQLNLAKKKAALRTSREKMATHKFSVGILGEFKRGKSTVINSLLEAEIVPADVIPTTATMNRITYDLTPHAEVLMKNGETKPIGVDELKNFVTKLDETCEATAADVEEAIVYYPCKFCQNGVDIIDTPGLNNDDQMNDRMNKVTEEVIPKLDAVIMVVAAGSPFSMSEAEFVRNKIMASDLGKIIFLVNKMDMIRKSSYKERVLNNIKARISASVLEKMEEIYGADSKEYQETAIKLDSIHVYPFSALDALEGKMEMDEELIAKSGTREFETALTKMLTEDRGALVLYEPLNLLASTVFEVSNVVKTRKNALRLSSEEFRKDQEQALEKIREVCKQKRSEVARLKDESKAVCSDITSRVSAFYNELSEKLDQMIADFPISPESMSTDAGKAMAAKVLSETVYNKMQEQMSYLAERVQRELQSHLNADIFRLGMTALQMGGASASLPALAVHPVAGIPAVIISCAAGTVAGKAMIKKAFHKDMMAKEIIKMRNNMRDSVHQYIEDCRKGRYLESWVNDTVSGRFEELIKTFENECEQMVADTQSTIDAIKQDLDTNEIDRKQKDKEFEQIFISIAEIWKELSPIQKKVNASLGWMLQEYNREYNRYALAVGPSHMTYKTVARIFHMSGWPTLFRS